MKDDAGVQANAHLHFSCHRKAAFMNPSKRGWTLLGRLLNSGWDYTPMKKVHDGFSMASTSFPSGLTPLKRIPLPAILSLKRGDTS